MIIRIELKNSAGLLLSRETKEIAMLWKTSLNHKGKRKYVIVVKEKGVSTNSCLFSHVEEHGTYNLHNNIVNALKLGVPEFIIKYTDAYPPVPDADAFRVMEDKGYSKSYIDFAYNVAQQKIKSIKGAGNFDPSILQGQSEEETAYLHGWGLIYPIELVFLGISPYQFYKFVLSQ